MVRFSAAFSRDGRRVVLSWHYDVENLFALWMVDLADAAPRAVSLGTFGATDGVTDYTYVAPLDWSPDGTSIAVLTERRGAARQQVGVLHTATRAWRVLTGERPVSTRMLFSGDGKFLVHDSQTGGQQDIYALAIAGGTETPIVTDPSRDTFAGWSADARHVLFFSDRTGTDALYAVAYADGAPQGEPFLVVRDLPRRGWIWPGVSGRILFEVRDARSIYGDINFATYDFANDRFVEPPALGVKDVIGRNAAATWPPDGRYLLNISDRNGHVLVLHSAETGAFVRELRSNLVLNQGGPLARVGAGPPLRLRRHPARTDRGVHPDSDRRQRAEACSPRPEHGSRRPCPSRRAAPGLLGDVGTHADRALGAGKPPAGGRGAR